MTPSWVCVDASFVLRMLLGPSAESYSERWIGWERRSVQPAAPTLLYYELTNGIHRYFRGGFLSEPTARMALRTTQALPITLVGDADLHGRALALAAELGLSAAYDTHYIALAERLGAELWTADARLARSVEAQCDYVRLATE